MLPLKFYVFSEQGNHTPMKTDGPGDPEFQKASAIVSSKSCILNSFNNAGWDNLDSQATPAKTYPLSWFC